MIKLDILQMNQTGDTFFRSTDVGYLVFMLIGIVAYFTIPSMANLIVNTGERSVLTAKLTSMSSPGRAIAVGGAGAGMAADAFGDANLLLTKGTTGKGPASGYFSE